MNKVKDDHDKIWDDIDNILNVPESSIKKQSCFKKIKKYLTFSKYKKLKNNKKL
jgi:hypothetical protein